MKKSFGPRTLIFPTPLWCIGSYDVNGNPNIMTVAWGGICCSDPPCVTVSLREAAYTYHNIIDRKSYTISLPSEEYVKHADYFGISSGRDTDKFRDTGLTPETAEFVDAPFVKEFPLILECILIHYHKIGSHTHFIGEILDVKIEDSLLTPDGNPDIKKIKPLIFYPGIREYFSTGKFIGKGFDIGKKYKS
jgi:flavin reductase (DIM6/NTAB) family NADH-FMN oxidoreductase RutF